MRFKRADLPGLAIAVLGPVGLFLLLLESYQLWHHHGSPILGILSVHIAIGGGIIGGLWRFVKARDAIIGLALALALAIIGVVALRSVGDGDTTLANILKIVSVVLFLVLNAAVIQQLLWNGLNPILQRRDDARAAAAAEEQA
ncbi:MAG: hypothetical protein M0R75_04820 [Dehalococcoidia bacterium]|nr:hypothetical protein [Dehalococcoidia bacterium]